MSTIRTLYSYLQQLSAEKPDKPLMGGGKFWLTARQVLAQVEARALLLREKGIQQGDYVLLRTRRDLSTALWILATQAIGAAAVLVDARENRKEICESIPVQLVLDSMDMYLPCPTVSSFEDTTPAADAPGLIIFTSGSTGKPKAVMLSQYNFVNNLLDSQPLGCYREDDIALGSLPMDHVFGLVLLAGVCVLGYSIYFPAATDIPSILQSIAAEKITRMNGVPSLYLSMAHQAAQFDLSSLRAGFIGGGPCTEEQFIQIEQALGITLIPVYGMSECIGIACGNWQAPPEIRRSGAGPFYPKNNGLILREDGSPAAPGEVGEICVTGPSRMIGYYPDVMPPEQLLQTGDLGYVDEAGTLHLTGRKKEIIIRNGVNLTPRSIEETLLSIPGVRDGVVVGLPHPIQGEVPYAMAVSSLTELELLALLVHRLPKNEIPVGIKITDHLPRTFSGKVDKQAVREVLKNWKV